MDTATPTEIALQAEVRQLRERITELETERLAARQQAEEQSSTLLATLEAALASMTDAVFISDAQGRFIHTNDAFATYHRFRNREECSKTIADCPDSLTAFLPDGTQAPPDMWAVPRALRGETVTNTEYTLHRKDTGETWVGGYSFAPIRGSDGAIAGAVVVARDVTKRKQAEDQVRRSQKTFSELVERAPFGIYVVDSQFRIAHMNTGSQNGAFRNVRPVIGRDFAEVMRILWPEPVAAEIIAAFRRTLETGEPYYPPPFFNPRHDVEAVEGYEWELHRMTLPDGRQGVICYYFDSTELRQAEAALRDSEERFRSVAENKSEGLMLFDAKGNFTYQNPASLRIHGFRAPGAGHVERENLPATWNAWDDTGRPMSFEEWPISRVLRGERFKDQILRAMRVETGQEFWASYNGCPILDANGRLTFGFITIREITEQRKAGMAMRESEERLRLALTAAELGTWDYNPVTGALIWDARCKELFGLPPETEVDYDIFLAGLHPDDRERANQVVQRTFDPASDGLFDIEYRTVGLRDGGIMRWVRATGRASFNAAGQPIRFVGTVQDITGRKRAEEALRLTQASVDGAAEMVAWFTPDGRVYYANDATCRTLGYSREELLQMSALDFSPGFNWEQYHQHWEEVRKRKSFTLEVMHRRKDGTEYPAEVLVNHVVYGGHEYIFAYGRDITERKRVEEALRQSESEQRRQREFLATLLANAPYGISVHRGRDLVYELVNPAYQSMVGSDIQLVGRAYREVFPEAAAAGVDAKLQQVIETGEPWIVDRFKAPIPGKPAAIWDGQVVRLPAAGDEPWILAIVWDVTKQAANEEALRESEGRLRLFVEHAPAAIAMFDRQMRYVAVSRRWLSDFRLGEQELIGRSHYDVFPEIPKRWEEIHRRCLAGATEKCDEDSFLRADGELDWVRWETRPWLNGKEEVGGIIIFSELINDRKRAEQALAASEGRLRALLESAAQGVVAADETGCILLVNARTEELFGYSRDELLGQPLELIVPERFRGVHANHRGQYFASPRTRQMGAGLDLEGRKKNGDSIALEVGLSFVEEGGTRLALALITDVTERKRSEEHFRQAQKLESLGLLAGGVAHDFNNLLVGVLGNASLAQEMLPPEHPAAELLERVVKTGEQAAHLTRQMLAYSGKGKFLVEALSLSKIIPDLNGLIRPSIPKKIAFRVELEEDLPAIEADRGQVQQVFMNLALNASEAIGNREGQITVRTGTQKVDGRYLRLHPEIATLRPGEYVCLEVRDNGCGMDDATKAKVFDPFFSTKFSGRGLGLAAVSGIVRGHKGAIAVTTAPGRGSSFTVLFPAAGRPSDEPQVRPASAGLRGSGVVLVVDDERFVLEMAKRALESRGYTVLMADSGPAAIDVLKRHPGDIALVVLDLSMPNMSGEEALPELRKIRPDVKVLVSSGYSEAETLTLFRGQRVSGFIQKPYTAVGLADGIRVCLA